MIYVCNKLPISGPTQVVLAPYDISICLGGHEVVFYYWLWMHGLDLGKNQLRYVDNRSSMADQTKNVRSLWVVNCQLVSIPSQFRTVTQHKI